MAEELGQRMRLNALKKQFIKSPKQLKINQYHSMVYAGLMWQKLWRQGTLSSVDGSGEFTLAFVFSLANRMSWKLGEEKYSGCHFFHKIFSGKVFFVPYLISLPTLGCYINGKNMLRLNCQPLFGIMIPCSGTRPDPRERQKSSLGYATFTS